MWSLETARVRCRYVGIFLPPVPKSRLLLVKDFYDCCIDMEQLSDHLLALQNEEQEQSLQSLWKPPLLLLCCAVLAHLLGTAAVQENSFQ